MSFTQFEVLPYHDATSSTKDTRISPSLSVSSFSTPSHSSSLLSLQNHLHLNDIQGGDSLDVSQNHEINFVFPPILPLNQSMVDYTPFDSVADEHDVSMEVEDSQAQNSNENDSSVDWMYFATPRAAEYELDAVAEIEAMRAGVIKPSYTPAFANEGARNAQSCFGVLADLAKCYLE
jgi:hypothetical protein